MAMDLWYELRLRELTDDVNAAASDLREAALDSADEAPDQEDES